MERIKMRKVIDGKTYNTETAQLIADDVYWDGSNFERNHRNTWLYKTPKGAYFVVIGSHWQGERDTLKPVSEEEAQRLYETLDNEQYVSWEEAFGREPEEPEPNPGRRPLYGETMRQTGIRLPVEMIAWLKARPEGVSEYLRALITREMEAEKPQ
jgi:hypothetical protein